MSNFSANSFLSFNVGMIETRLALPQRSPSPLSVPWICRAPARTAASETRHRLLGVVVGMDADVIAGDDFRHRLDDGFDLVRQRAAIGVAQHDPARALVIGGLGAGEREFRIGLVAVEEMLAVEQHFAALRLGGRTLSRIEARFSSSVVSSATRT